MSAVNTYRHFKKQDEIFMGMSLITLMMVILTALSLFYIAVSFKLAINSPLLLFLALVWMIVIALIIKAGSGDEVPGFYSSIFTHPLADLVYALRAGTKESPEQPSLEELIDLKTEQEAGWHLSTKNDDLIAVIKVNNGVQWLNCDASQRQNICKNWTRFLAQMQSTTSLKSYFSSGTNDGDCIQAFTHVRRYSLDSRGSLPLAPSAHNEKLSHLDKDNILFAQKQHQDWFQELIESRKFIPELDFYLIIKHKIQRNKTYNWLLSLRRKLGLIKALSETELEQERTLLKQKIELCMISLRSINIYASLLKETELKSFVNNYHPCSKDQGLIYDRAKYLEHNGTYSQTLRLSSAPEAGDLSFWLKEILASIKSEAYLSVVLTHRDAHKDRRRAETKAEITRQLAKGSRSSTQAIIKENSDIAADLINQPQSYDLSIFITLKSKSLKELEEESLKVAKPYSGSRISNLDRQQIKNYISSLPFASLKLKNREQLFASSSFAGACFSFLKNELGTKTGALMGISLENSRPVYLDEYDRSVCHNRNINFIGDSGSGKTVAAKLAVKRRLEKGGSFVIIDNTTDGWQFFVDYYGGTVVEIDTSISPDGLGYFAPLELADNASITEINKQIENAVRLLSLIKNRSSEISVEEEFFLVRCLTKLYELNSKPSLSDLYKFLDSFESDYSSSYQKAIAPYSRCCNGIYSGLMDGKSARIKNGERLLLITLSKVEADANFLPVALFLTMNYVSQRVLFRREAALTLIVDEAWKIFTGTKAKVGKDALSFFARAGRGMDLGLWTISQKPQDLPREVHSSASCCLCFQLKETSDKHEMIAVAGLNSAEASLMQHPVLSESGNSFLNTTRSSGLVQIVMDDIEAVLSNSTRSFSTKRDEIYRAALKAGASSSLAARATVERIISFNSEQAAVSESNLAQLA